MGVTPEVVFFFLGGGGGRGGGDSEVEARVTCWV